MCREDEWERAARGADGRIYPHGNALQPEDANYDRTYGRKALAYGLDEVGSHPASDSPFGIQDMAGNAWEMVASWSDDRSAGYRVLRGGSYYHSALDAVTANRWMIERGDSDSRVGFRVCAPAPVADFDQGKK
jgi:formylglycine-generating enzyme required for sulfatase activity